MHGGTQTSAQQGSWGLGRTARQRAASLDPSAEAKPYPFPEIQVQRQRDHPSPVIVQPAILFLAKAKYAVLSSVRELFNTFCQASLQ